MKSLVLNLTLQLHQLTRNVVPVKCTMYNESSLFAKTWTPTTVVFMANSQTK